MKQVSPTPSISSLPILEQHCIMNVSVPTPLYDSSPLETHYSFPFCYSKKPHLESKQYQKVGGLESIITTYFEVINKKDKKSSVARNIWLMSIFNQETRELVWKLNHVQDVSDSEGSMLVREFCLESFGSLIVLLEAEFKIVVESPFDFKKLTELVTYKQKYVRDIDGVEVYLASTELYNGLFYQHGIFKIKIEQVPNTNEKISLSQRVDLLDDLSGYESGNIVLGRSAVMEKLKICNTTKNNQIERKNWDIDLSSYHSKENILVQVTSTLPNPCKDAAQQPRRFLEEDMLYEQLKNDYPELEEIMKDSL